MPPANRSIVVFRMTILESKALQIVRHRWPDIVLLDVNLEEQSGVETARTLRRRGYEGPIVALTASRLNDEEKDEFTCCFRKPAAMPKLLEAIKTLTHPS